MKIALVISSLGPGGAERVVANLANAWAARGTLVTLVTLSDSASDFFKLHRDVQRIALSATASSSNAISGAVRNLWRIRALRLALLATAPDIVVSFMTTTNVLAVLACRPLHIHCVVAERTSPPSPQMRGLWALAVRYAYSRARGIVVQTQRGAMWFRERFPAVPIRVIPNPIAEAAVLATGDRSSKNGELEGEQPYVVAMGRLTREKGFDLLLDAFARVCRTRPGLSLAILGEGPERQSLERQSRSLGLGARIRFLGLVRDPQPILRRAIIFVLSSRFEGMPMALLEAMACGLPCVCFDCPTGPREILTDGVNGILISPEDVPSLARGIESLLDDPPLRKQIGAEATKVLNRYRLEDILDQWDKALAEAIDTPMRHPNRSAMH